MIIIKISILRYGRERDDGFWSHHCSQILDRMTTPPPSHVWTGSDKDQVAGVTLTDFDKTSN
jgi:hypothetical protein